ncbi:hypothetical protein HmCmsJML010_04158 [Escherichia coli]|jgi:hypothetical protein|uniref:Uncharacterized protein n=6 Tax=Enterobacteriaceae TaxID=543 RepID=A0A4C4ZU91_ECOLX|nr:MULTISPECIES: hypothetical protein [Enterobacteriaceae]EFK88210.1 hypothetical protein HMPREF9543_05009 [Escherichia coli MS 146-1]ARD69086.1 Hypothetical protein [Enterobacter cloacae]MDF3746606.1 hypothetical protein [Enterobacter hormaechei]OXZ47843.1 hypothetical protein RW70_04518 [Escherichia coli]OZO51289.1 hypothetical protein CG706_27515 [Escherichia coli]
MSLYVHAAGQKVNIIESKIAGLGFLQAIIARMANNSFYIKGWDLTLFVAVVALKKDASQYSGYLLLALIVSTIAFCLLDAYYLQQERIFRKIYNYLAESNSESINYFSINPVLYKDILKGEMLSYRSSLISTSILLFHIPMFVAVFIFFVLF